MLMLHAMIEDPQRRARFVRLKVTPGEYATLIVTSAINRVSIDEGLGASRFSID